MDVFRYVATLDTMMFLCHAMMAICIVYIVHGDDQLWVEETSIANRQFANALFLLTTPAKSFCVFQCQETPTCRLVTYNSVSNLCSFYPTVFGTGDSFVYENDTQAFTLPQYRKSILCGDFTYDETVDLCYSMFLNQASITFQAAKDRCAGDGAQLVSLSTTARYDLITNKLTQLGATNYIWLGLDDLVSEGDWKWFDGTTFSLSSNWWFSGEPDNYPPGEHCARMFSGDMLIRDTVCTYKNQNYICERILVV